MTSPLARAKKIFAAALEVAESKRSVFLDEACGDDPGLREQVDRLLQAFHAADDFLVGGTDPGSIATSSEAPGAEQPGDVIDRYKLLQQIGEGGMGTVWMAEQHEPVRRKVALKVIKLGMDTKAVVARFEAERQALALMDHPNIAKVLDGGSTSAGRPYFVMELVKGVPITEFCDKAALDTRERLRLMQQVCLAVQHAHQKGVIHRDLKPGNVLVTLHDGNPVPKVIDFGIAKATSAELTQRTLFTEFQQMVGTPEYMAPEQAELSGLDIDTRADVYSLGVLLYELLTGTQPFDLGKVLAQGYAEMLRVIREDDPPKPSTRVSTLGHHSEVIARSRRTTARRLSKFFTGDLDWIVLRAMEKERARRYVSASDLAADLARHLNDEPVHARPPSSIYRARKFLRRNTATAVAGVLVFLSISAGLTVSLAALFEARDQRDAARRSEAVATEARARTSEALRREQAQREIAVTAQRQAERDRTQARVAGAEAAANAKSAEAEAARLTAVMGLIRRVLGFSQGKEPKPAGYTMAQMLDDFDRELGEDLDQDPAVAHEVRTFLSLGYLGLGQWDKARKHASRAIELREPAFGGLPPNSADDAAVLIQATARSGDFWAAETLARRELDLRRALGRQDLALASLMSVAIDAFLRIGLLAEAESLVKKRHAIYEAVNDREGIEKSMVCRGIIETRRGFPQRGLETTKAALSLQRKRLGNNHPSVATSLHNLATMMNAQAEAEESLGYAQEALSIYGHYLPSDHHDFIRAQLTLGNKLFALSRFKEAERLFRKAIGSLNRKPEPSLEDRLNVALLALALKAQGKTQEAETYFDEAVDLLRTEPILATPRDLYNVYALSDVLRTHGRREDARMVLTRLMEPLTRAVQTGARDYSELTRIAEAARIEGIFEPVEKFYEVALENHQRHSGSQHAAVAVMSINLAGARTAMGKIKEAQEPLRNVLSMQFPNEKPKDAQRLQSAARFTLARLLGIQGDLVQARSLAQSALAEEIALGDGGNSISPKHALLGEILLAQGEFAASEHHTRAAIDGFISTYGSESAAVRSKAGWDVLGCYRTLTRAVARQGRVADAIPVGQRALDIARELYPAEDPNLSADLDTLSQVLERAGGRAAQVRDLCKEALHLLRDTHAPVDKYHLRHRLMWTHWELHEFADAEDIAKALLPSATKRLGDKNLQVAGIQVVLGTSLVKRGDFQSAEPLLRAACRTRTDLMPGDWRAYAAMGYLGESLAGLRQFEEAETLLLEACEKMVPPEPRRMARVEMIQRLVDLYTAWDRPKDAEAWVKKREEAKSMLPEKSR